MKQMLSDPIQVGNKEKYIISMFIILYWSPVRFGSTHYKVQIIVLNHILGTSPWPVLRSASIFTTLTGIALILNIGIDYIWELGLIGMVICFSMWWWDVIIESTYLGHHTNVVRRGIGIGFYLFILSEIFLFFTLFWAQLNAILVPDVEIGGIYPPIKGITSLQIPILNTILLLSSGVTVTWSHYALLNRRKNETIVALLLTIGLALVFTSVQALEYYYAPFTWADGIYGNVFYGTTGLHAIHVIIGNIFLIVNFFRIIRNHLTTTHHTGFELAILYWHFVDIVWLLLFIVYYYWGS